jgi:RNA polymerase sigma factor (sigma-70 family)
MDLINELPDLVSLYQSDLRRFESLSDAQQFWLGIVLDSERILQKLFTDKDPNDEKDCDFLYIGVFNKIREIYDQLVKFSSKNSIPLTDYIVETIKEIVEFKETSKPVKRTILYGFFDALPNHSHALIYDLIGYFWLLPSPLLDFYQAEISQKNKIPSIAKALNVLNPLDSVLEIKTLRDQGHYAKEMLIESFLLYVKFFAFKYRNRGLEYEDVIQEGNLGLMKAVDKYDVRMGAKFKTFGLWWIKQRIMRAIANDSRTIRFPVHLHDKINKILEVRALYQKNHAEEPSISDLAEMSGFTVEDVSRLIEYTKPDMSLEILELCENNLMRNYLTSDYDPGLLLCRNCPLAEDESFSFDDSIVDDHEPPLCLEQSLIDNDMSKSDRANRLLRGITVNPDEDDLSSVQTEILRTVLQSELDNLSPRYTKLLELRYGLNNNGDGMTLEELGQKLGVTRERIRQMEVAAKTILGRSYTLKGIWEVKKILE